MAPQKPRLSHPTTSGMSLAPQSHKDSPYKSRKPRRANRLPAAALDSSDEEFQLGKGPSAKRDSDSDYDSDEDSERGDSTHNAPVGKGTVVVRQTRVSKDEKDLSLIFRKVSVRGLTDEDLKALASGEVDEDAIENLLKSKGELVARALHSVNVETQAHAITKLREFVVAAINNTKVDLDDVVRCKLLTMLSVFLGDDVDQKLKNETLWILIDVAAGTSAQTQAVVNAGLIEPLIFILKSKKSTPDQKHNANWCLGNIIADRMLYRNIVLDWDPIPEIVDICKHDRRAKAKSIALWSFTNMMGWKLGDEERWTKIRPMIPVLKDFLREYKEEDEEVMRYAILGLSRVLGNASSKEVHKLASKRLCDQLSKMLNGCYFQSEVLDCVINITGTLDCSENIEGPIKNEFPSTFNRIIDQKEEPLITRAIKVIANIIRFPSFEDWLRGGLVKVVIRAFKSTGYKQAKREAARTLMQASKLDSFEVCKILQENQYFVTLRDYITALDADEYGAQLDCVEVIQNVLAMGEKQNPQLPRALADSTAPVINLFLEHVKQFGGVDLLFNCWKRTCGSMEQLANEEEVCEEELSDHSDDEDQPIAAEDAGRVKSVEKYRRVKQHESAAKKDKAVLKRKLREILQKYFWGEIMEELGKINDRRAFESLEKGMLGLFVGKEEDGMSALLAVMGGVSLDAARETVQQGVTAASHISATDPSSSASTVFSILSASSSSSALPVSATPNAAAAATTTQPGTTDEDQVEAISALFQNIRCGADIGGVASATTVCNALMQPVSLAPPIASSVASAAES